MTDRGDERGSIRVGTVLKNKWRIDERIGAGGMATVYAATHRNGSRVAIKVLTKTYSSDPMARERFLREGYAANAVGHPAAVKILDDDVTEDGSAFLVMELLEGESLESIRLRNGGKIELTRALTIADELLDLLAAAHDRRIVHRDIKPENVFITHTGEMKLLDFGVAQMRTGAGKVTGAGLMLGTPDFMSPEQAGGHPDEIDGRSDLWAVGAMLFLLLSGETVHVTETLRDHIIATATKQARSLGTVAPEVPAAVVAVVDRALRLDKRERWSDAHAMRSALFKARTSGIVSLTDPVDDAEATEFKPMEFSDAPPPPNHIVSLAQTADGLEATMRAEKPQPSPPAVRTERMPNLAQAVKAVDVRLAAAAAAPPAPKPQQSLGTLHGHARGTASVAKPRSNARVALAALIVLSCVAVAAATWLFPLGGRHAASPAPSAAPSAKVPEPPAADSVPVAPAPSASAAASDADAAPPQP